MIITLISDSHNKHKQLNNDLPGGDLIIHAGDWTSMGYIHEMKNFLNWYENLNYNWKIYIAGNHELGFRDSSKETYELIKSYEEILDYLEDSLKLIGELDQPVNEHLKIYGSPWQPEFCNWAFNLPRNGQELYQRWANIPLDTDILITHGPPFGILDTVKGRTDHLGCQLLANRLQDVKPKIAVSGHIHSGNGYYFDGTTHYFNASVLNEQYKYEYKPFTFNWDKESNKIEFL